MLDLVVKDGRAVGIVTRDLITGAVQSHAAHAVVLAHRRLRQRVLPVHERQGEQRHRRVACGEEGRAVREPVLHADPPHVHPAERRLPVEAHADVGVAAQRRARLGAGEARRPALARPDPRSRARLLPRAPLPRVRQPRAARHRVARREARGRRRPRRRAAEERRLPRPRRLDQAPRPRRHRGALREPHRDVRAHHRRGPVQGADADLPRDPLHDGRALGRLRPHEQRARPLRARRGELLRPRRQPARRERAHAGPRRRLLRAAVARSPTTSRRCLGETAGRRRRPRVPRGGERGERADPPAHVDQRQPLGRPLPPRARQRAVGLLRHGAQPGDASRRRSPRSPRSATSSTPT